MKDAHDTVSVDILNCMRGGFMEEMRTEVLSGLSAEKKCLPSKYFYDPRGSLLFEKICLLPEYYQTRTEMLILTEYADEIMEGFDAGSLIEFGSGADWKIRKLLDRVERGKLGGMRYVAVDVSETALRGATEQLARSYPDLTVLGVVADFARHIGSIPLDGRRNMLIFFGSTIGNLSERESRKFMRNVRALMGDGDRFLLGLDMVKDREILEKAYNDSQGITAEFNKNILNVINRELNAEFDPEDFSHRAFYREEKEQIEMHLAAKKNLSVRVDGLDMVVVMKRGETILTEVCRKFSRRSAADMVHDAGLEIKRWFSDPKGWFSLVDLAKIPDS